MLQRLRGNNEKGFTLIELMIVIAIIGILAAIAIPQFAAYRVRSFNASAQSDVRNVSTSEAAFFSDWQVFGNTQAALPAAAVAAAGNGALLTGPSGTTDIIGALDANATGRGLNIAIGNLVSLVAGTDGADSSFAAVAKHLNGDTTYGADSDTTAMYHNPGVPGVGIAIVAGDNVAPTTAVDDFALAGAPWVAK